MYNFDEIIDRHGTRCLNVDTLEETFGRPDLVSLWVADMDFRTPDFITGALRRRLDHPILGYPSTGADYFRIVSDWVYRLYGWRVCPEHFRYIPGDEVTKPDCMVTLKGNGEISLANHASFISATSASAIKVEGASLFRFENTKTIMSAGLNPDPFVDISARSVDVTLAEGSMLGGVTGEILRVGSIATYGIVRNAGLIQTGAGQTAVNILGSNIRLELLEGGRITGNVVLAGNVGNSLFAGAGSDRVNGGVVAAGCDVVLEILSGDSYGSLSASGNIDIGGSNLILDMSAADLDVGDSLTLVSAGAGITGSFVGLSDGDVLTLSNSSGVIYELLISVGSSGISAKVTSVVPEPAHIAALLGAVALAASARRKRNGN